VEGTAGKKSDSLPNLVSGERVFDDAHDVLLLFTRQLARPFKNLPQFASRATSAGLFFDAKKGFDGNAEGLGELGEILGLEGNGRAFPIGIAWLSDAESVGKLGLGQTGLDAGGVKTLAERGAVF